MSKRKQPDIRDRIIDFRRVLASELVPDPKNWRRHPKAQRDALTGVLEEIGYADALLVRETVDGLQIIDGHLRAETTPGQLVPVLVLDVNEAEAAKLLATLDPLAAMAETDAAALDALLRDVDTGNAAVQAMLAAMADDAGLTGIIGNLPTDAKRDNNNMGMIGGELGPWVGLQWGDIMVSLPRDVYESVLEVVDDPAWPSRKDALAAILQAGSDAVDIPDQE